MSDLEKGTSGKQRGKQHESQGEQRPGLLFPVSMKYLVQEVMGNSLSGKREKVMDTHTHTHTPHSVWGWGVEKASKLGPYPAPPHRTGIPPHTHTRSWGSPPPRPLPRAGKATVFSWRLGDGWGPAWLAPGVAGMCPRPHTFCPQVLRAVEHPPRHGLGPLGRSLATAPAPRPHRGALPGPGTQIQAALQHRYRRASLRGAGWEEGLARSVSGVGCCTPGRRAGGPFWGGLCPGRSGRTG